MSKFIITTIIFSVIFFGCKPKSTTENISRTEEEKTTKVLPPKDALVSSMPAPSSQTEDILSSSYISRSRYGVTSCDLLRGDDLKYFSPRELRLVRNEIFARHGYQFKDTVLQAYFDKQDWYKPLYDNVDEYITPLERANINFILEKEKTNPKISDEEQFKVFLETYKNYNYLSSETPRMLLYKFFVSDHGCIMNGSHYYSGQLPPTKNYVYLIHSIYGLCDQCTYYHRIYQFNKKGELLNNFHLGESDNYSPFVEEKSNNRYEIWFTLYSGPRYSVGDDEVTDEMWEEASTIPIDTIRIPFYYDNDGQIILVNQPQS